MFTYKLTNESEDFAKRFCPTRLTENEDVADQSIKVWDKYVAAVKHYEWLSKSKQPKDNSSYQVLLANINDKLMKLKFWVCLVKWISSSLFLREMSQWFLLLIK